MEKRDHGHRLPISGQGVSEEEEEEEEEEEAQKILRISL